MSKFIISLNADGLTNRKKYFKLDQDNTTSTLDFLHIFSINYFKH